MSAEGDEGVESGREDPRSPDEGPLHGKLDERLRREAVAALEGDSEPHPAQIRLVALARETQSVELELGRPGLVAQAEVGKAAEEQVAGIPYARSREVRGDRGPRTIRLGGERVPVSERVCQLEHERDRVDAVVCREALRQAAVKLGQASRLVEAADGGSRRRARLVRLAQVIRIVDSGKQREPLVAPGGSLLEAPLVECCLRSRSECERAELEASERIRKPGCLLENVLRGTEQLDVRSREKRPHPCLAVVRRELQRPRRPLLDELHIQADRPHCRPDRGLEREERVRIRLLLVVERTVERVEQRLPHSFAVVTQRLRLADCPPEEGLFMGVHRQRYRTVVELDRLVELVASACESTGSRKPVHGACTDARELVRLVGPHEIRVFLLRRLGVVVREDRCPLVRAPFREQIRERRVQPPATSLRNRSVRDLARQGVLDDELAVGALRRGTDRSDEVALFEHSEVRLLAAQQVHDRSRREDASHHGARL